MASGQVTPDLISEGIARDLLKSRRAVIDVGSNSIRLVIYGGPPRTPLAIFNEKDLCGLGTLEPETGALRREAMDATLGILRRFRTILNLAGDIPVSIFATAAIREAPNGAEFVGEIRALGLTPVILTGKEEARFAALGVLAGAPSAITPGDDGRLNLCGDMGGGSLELTRFSGDFEKPFLDRVSLPLGPLRLITNFGETVTRAEKFVDEQLAEQKWLGNGKSGTLFAVGGAWRAIAKVHMAKTEYELSILHHYEIPGSEMLALCHLLQRQSAASLEQMPGVQRKRINALPHAAMVMGKVLEVCKAEQVIISAGGVREGILFDQLTPEERQADPLLVMAREYARRYSPNPVFGERVFEITTPLFPKETVEERRIRLAACIMCDLAAMHHPDMRAEHASDIILHSPLTGVDHHGRITVAAALFFRHRSKGGAWPDHIPHSLITPELENLAIALGMALRFLADFSAGSVPALEHCAFILEGDRLIFRAPESRADLDGDTPQKRLAALASQLQCAGEQLQFKD